MQIVSDFTTISTDDVWTDSFNQLRQVLTFGFAETLPDHHTDVATKAFRDSFQPLSNAERDIAREAVQIYEDASRLAFVEVASEDADIIFVGKFDFLLSPADAFSIGFAFTPAGGALLLPGDVFINAEDADSLDLYIYELGHALGLEHAFEGDRILSDDLANRANTVKTIKPTTSDTLGVLDIQAIQSMYGTPDQTPH